MAPEQMYPSACEKDPHQSRGKCEEDGVVERSHYRVTAALALLRAEPGNAGRKAALTFAPVFLTNQIGS